MSMIGKSLAHYQITGLIGKGGMGEVYQAKDQKLGRDVAIKVLPVEFARDTDRVTRFRREAKLLASLNHPNIASVYGLEETGETHFLVMELIEGATLAERIKAGPIPVEDALKLALQITEALEAAHDKGVIHRDLKPANIKVTPEGKVKVLDFGLAKAFAGDPENRSLSNSPTLSDAATMQGVILGTAAYMPPEQAKGKTVDKRADIWAFGVVLFELLTGRQSFTGESVSETLASVIKSEPEWQSLPPNLHPRIRFLLERCLEKDPRNRYGAINDARVDIQKVLADPGGVFAQPVSAAGLRGKQRSTLSLVAAAVVLTAVIVGGIIWYLKPAAPPEPRRVVRLSYALPDDQQFNIKLPATGHTLAVSPDGSQYVYSTKDGLYLRSEDELEARLISGTDKENPQSPFFSPDGKWVGYWSQQNRQLRKVSISGGSPVTLCAVAWIYGAEWRPDNTIVFSDMPKGIFRVSADGGAPELLVEGPAIAPQILQNGKSILFTSVAKDTFTIVVQSLESQKRKELFAGVAARYLPTGHIVYALQNSDTLYSVPFDPEKLDVTGVPVPRIAGMLGPFFAVSDSGTLVYIPGAANDAPDSGRTLMWVDKMGKETPINAPPNFYTVPDISPDGTKVALAADIDGNMDIYIWDIARENLTRLTFDKKMDIQPIWTPDGKRIIYMSDRDGMMGIYSQAANGTGEVEKHGSAPDLHLLPWSWSHDAKTLIIAEMSADYQKVDIGMQSMQGDGARKLLLKEDYVENHPQISPDGRWMAYFSSEDGKWEIYVCPFPDVDQGRWQVSPGGGESPRWSPDGRELYYITQKGDAVMSVPVETEPTFSAGKPRELFRGTFVAGYRESPPYDIDRDGKRFLMIKPPRVPGSESAGALPRKINIVLNWFEELKQQAPAK